MSTPARRHLEKKADRQIQGTAELAESPEFAAASPLKHYQMAMEIDLAKLKELKLKPQKIAAKAELLSTYVDFVQDYMEQGHDYPNSVAVEVMIWQIDIGQVEQGLKLAYVLIEQGQHLPPRFTATIPTYLCDNLYDWANEQLTKGQPVSPWLDEFCAKVLSEQWEIHPVPAAKPFVMLAKHKFKSGDYQACLDACNHAEAFNENAGVKKLKADAEKKLAQ